MKISKELEAAATFAILMQDIKDKSPSYLLEKYHSTQSYDRPRNLLDGDNLKIFKDWLETWHINEDK